MLLAIDLGNTNLTIGLYNGAALGPHWRLATDHNRMPDEYGIQITSLLEHYNVEHHELTGIVLSSVVPPLTYRIVEACQQYLHTEPLIITPNLQLGITIAYEDPNAVGADRIADAVAVNTFYGGPACIIDFGTATTFNALTKDGVYLGGAITAGLGLSSEALFSHAAKLPRVELKEPPAIIGRNTIHALQSGLVYGYASMVIGMIERFKKEMGDDIKVIATGGLVGLIAPHVPAIQIRSPWLTLDGLRILWENNH
ncbi:MAG: type III pantothenate kinase [Anaerolineaceae bacterium]